MKNSDVADRRAPLSRDRIVDVAMDLARREGLAGVSMRKIAGVLGVEAMSLYHHVPSKATLMVLMADRSVSLMPPPDPARPWPERLAELMVQTFLAAVANPALFPVLATAPLHPDSLPSPSPEIGAPSLGLLEQVLMLLEEGQVPVPLRVHIFRGLVGLVVGFTVGQVDGLLPAPAAADGAASARITPPQPPLLHSMRPALAEADPAQGLRCTLEVFLDGLTARTEPDTSQRPASERQ